MLYLFRLQGTYQDILTNTVSGVFANTPHEDLKFKIEKADLGHLQFLSEPSEILNLRSSNTPETVLVSIS